MLTYYKYPVTSIPLENYGAYFVNDNEAQYLIKNQIHNAEWMILQKIQDNEEGFFDFSKNMIDIGAFDGVYSFELPFQQRFMFEPNRERYFICHANALLHGIHEQANIYNCAVGDHNGTIKFDGFCSGDYTDRPSWMVYESKEVPCITLDSMKEQLTNIGFIKIDIEGNEPYALAGAYEVIRNNNYPPILFESWPNEYMDFGAGVPMETPDQYTRRVNALNNIFGELEYEVLEYWGDGQTHLAIHK